MNDGFFARAYHRLRFWYYPMMCGIVVVWAAFLTTSVAIIANYRYMQVGWPQTVHVLRYALVGIELGVAYTIAALTWRTKASLAWIRGDRTEPLAAWEASANFPMLVFKIAPPAILIGAIPALVMSSRGAHAPWYGVAAFALGIAVVSMLGIVVVAAGAEVMIAPVTAEIDAELGDRIERPQVKVPSIQRRLVVTITFIVWTCALFTGGLVTSDVSPAMRLVLAIGVALLVSLTFGFVVSVATSQSVAARVTQLLTATNKLAAGDLTARVPVLSGDEFGKLSASFNAMTAGLAERAALHSALGTYLDPVVADRLLSEGEFLKGESVEVTVLFADIVGFTTRAENMDPQEAVAELNAFFEMIVPAIERHQGHTNKLLGDGLMAVFGTPIPLIEHADHALAAACEMRDAIWDRYHGSLRAGIGINSGIVTVGTTGGGRKLDYTVIGDTVNVASRVEGLTRTTGDVILLTEATRNALRRPASLAPRGSVAIRGREAETPIYSVVASTRA